MPTTPGIRRFVVDTNGEERYAVDVKKKIRPEDILKGDTVRTEYTGTDGTPRAFEYVASIDGDTAGSGDVVFYLLNRPFQWGDGHWR